MESAGGVTKKFLLTLVVVGMCFGMVGRVSQRPLIPGEIAAERERQIQVTTRIYEGKTSEEVLLAADRVFRLADDDYNVLHQGTSLQAQRNWLVYIVIATSKGTDTWVVQAFPVENGTKVTAAHNG